MWDHHSPLILTKILDERIGNNIISRETGEITIKIMQPKRFHRPNALIKLVDFITPEISCPESHESQKHPDRCDNGTRQGNS